LVSVAAIHVEHFFNLKNSIKIPDLTPLPLRGQGGFTLVELIVVIIVTGILAVVALPRLSLLTGYKDPGHRDQIKAAIEYARKIAVAQRRHTCVVISSNVVTLTRELVIPESHAGTCPSYATALNLPTGGNTLSPPNNVTVTAATIDFDAQGMPPAAFTTTVISVTDGSVGGGTSTLSVEAGTGYVHS
jgi:MSHA pilin protein MshC